MIRNIVKRITTGVVALFYCVSVTMVAGGAMQVSAASVLNGHTVLTDSSGKIVTWLPVQDQAYGQVSAAAWNYLLSLPNNVCGGKPAYFCYSYLNPDTGAAVNWPHNPAGLYAMLIESALAYYQYSGDARVLQIAQNVANQQLSTGMTLATDNWASVPYSSGNAGSLTYNGASVGNSDGVGDGTGVLQPDKIAELGHGFVQLYKLTGNQAYLTAAINGANALVSHVRTGSSTQSPWAFRVVAATGAVKEQYSAHISSPIELFDDLISLQVGNTAGYQSARTVAWNWLMAYPMQNNAWSQYFEDVPIKTTPTANLNQLDALMVARYLLQHPETDANWETHVRGIISWVETTFGASQYGALTIKEQQEFAYAMGSHTSRYAEVNALLYRLTGDSAAREKAYRSFNWATYMARGTGSTPNGAVIDGPQVNNQWFTDGYGDYIRHFMIGMAAIPDYAPAGQNHLLETTSIVQNVAYADANHLNYQTFNTSGTEELKLTSKPTEVLLGGAAISERADLSAEGWTWDAAKNVLKVRRDAGTVVAITLGGIVSNQTPTVTLTAPANNATYPAPATINLSATATDPDGSVSKVEFYQNGSLVGTSATAPYSLNLTNLTAGNYVFTARAYDDQNAVGFSASANVTVTAPSTLPAGWTNGDIGTNASGGSATYSSGVFTVKGAGDDIYDSADNFNYTYTTMTGDGSVTARLSSLQNTDEWALAGVMLRDSLAANAKEALSALTPSHGYAFDYRTATNGATTYVNGGTGSAPGWLRLTRAGSVISAYKSTNGTTWTKTGSATISMGTTIYAGLAVAAHKANATLATDTFDNVTVSGAGDTTAPTISNIVVGATSVNGANITWSTDEPATSQVDYGTTTSYSDSTAINTTLDTTHSQIVAGLNDGTTYHYRVRSTDGAGNTAVSGDNTFTTPDVTPPTTPSNVMAIPESASKVVVSWTLATDNKAVTGYTIYRDGEPIGTSTTTSYSDTGLASGTTYTYAVSASDAAGNVSAMSDPATANTPEPDTTAPVVALTAPVDSSTVSGSVAVTADASDNLAVSKVEAYVDGTLLGSDSSSPYSFSWNTMNSTNGVHNLTAMAYDASGNVTTSTAVSVTVNNVVAAAALSVDRTVNTHQSTKGTTIAATVSTTQTNELLVAFITSDGPSGSISFSSVNGGGLTWTLRKRTNTRAGTSEIWTAPAASKLTNVTVTATRSSGSYVGSMTVVSFIGASLTSVGATGGANAASGAPSVSLTTTRANAWVWGVGNDWDNDLTRTVGSNQTKVDEYLNATAGDTFWVQRRTAVTPLAGTNVTLNDSAPTSDRWNFSAIEIIPAQ